MAEGTLACSCGTDRFVLDGVCQKCGGGEWVAIPGPPQPRTASALPRERRSSGYRVLLTPSEKEALERDCDVAGISMADAFRNGIRLYLTATLISQGRRGI